MKIHFSFCLLISCLAVLLPGLTDAATPQVSAGNFHTVGLKSDGTVVAVGDNDLGQCDVGGAADIQQIAAGHQHTVGLKSDGTVVAVGLNFQGQCNVSGWVNIQQVAAGMYHTVGLKSDGTVVTAGDNIYGQCNVSGWAGIQQVAACHTHTVGLKSDGTVVAVGENSDGQGNVSGWANIQQVAAGTWHTVGLKSDGTVVAVGQNDYGQCDVSGAANIQQIAAGLAHTVGLKSDGTVVAVGVSDGGALDYDQCNVSGWSNIQQVAAGNWHTVGLKSDGTVVAVGHNLHGQCDLNGWNLSAAACQTSPPAPTLTSPTGTVNQAMSIYVWESDPCADHYHLLIQNQLKKTIFKQRYPAATVDNGDSTCSINPLKVLSSADYYWLVRAENQYGVSANSAKMAFTVATTQVPPVAPTLNTPTGTIADTAPTFDWDTVATADHYYLIIQNSGKKSIYKNWYAAADVDNGDDTCSINPGKKLAPGDYYWLVRAKNQWGIGSNSTKMAFTISP